ncbi:MAG: Rrf2 family transcriptional regulator [Neomegalonema sp.]|nr:Rrf2 family transcriptional regulator [Neomegalonema sp.]
MKLSTKGRYAVTALADMALTHAQNGGRDVLIPLADISARQSISLPYLEQLFGRLRRAKLVESMRGPGGGYRLARDPDAIPLSEIMSAVDETLRATRCDKSCGASQGCGGTRESCLTHDLWEHLSAQVYLFLHNISLADVIEKRLAPCNALPDFAALLEEEGGADADADADADAA